MTLPSYARTTLFPNARSLAFFYEGTYVQKDTLPHGSGFWLKFDSGAVASIAGTPILSDSVTVSARWNIIGSLGTPTPTANITTNPPGIVSSSFFSYSGGYILDDTLVPGKGYWVRVSAGGKLFLASSAAAPKDQFQTADRSVLAEANSLTILNEEGAAQTLYFAQEPPTPLPAGLFDLPPIPPAGVFDARFASNRLLELFPAKLDGTREFSVAIRSSSPVAVTWHVAPARGVRFSLRAADDAGQPVSRPISGDGTWKLTSENLSSLRLNVESGLLPLAFALRQNYPNPFNPATIIGYDLPSDEHVTLAVYDLLSREVARLVDARQEAGAYEVQFSASNLASGMYFYRLTAGKFTSDHKMLIMK